MKLYNKDIGIEFGIEKCAMLIIKSGKQKIREGIELPHQEKIKMKEKKKLTNTWEY